ncbi:hypothetical protein ANN_17997 [Periplaneta americana]|uniref:Uncharacterized protein n=1 Tax=Periplaneta americana TaxID=6978 RepID=A0ABQ8SN07_PERAM|nr:hypothetical protein ANN_17997 [Periplaneta americana]
MDLREVGYDDRDWIDLARDRDQWRAYLHRIDDVLVSRGIDGGMFFWLRMQQIQAHELRTDAIDLRRLQNNITDRRRIRSPGVILDPTIRFEMHEQQPQEVCREKQVIYEPCCQHLGAQYHITHWTVFGLMFGARGTIPRETLNQLNLKFLKKRLIP